MKKDNLTEILCREKKNHFLGKSWEEMLQM